MTVVIIPLSSSVKAHAPLTIAVKALNKSSVVVCDQIRAVDKSRLIECVGSLSNNDLSKVEDGLRQIRVL